MACQWSGVPMITASMSLRSRIGVEIGARRRLLAVLLFDLRGGPVKVPLIDVAERGHGDLGRRMKTSRS